ncbi:MAG: ribonuclease HI family protein [Actinomycetota bacterium]|nr:ribonuclease HI family protein [Actinomycetota bacterium]
MEYLKIYFDGGSRGNPGPSAVGIVIYDQDGNLVEEISQFIGHQTNNVAEYQALLKALEAAEKYGADKVILITDSKLVHNQVKKIWKIKDENLLKIYIAITQKLSSYKAVDLRLVPREQNQEADKLVNQALDSQEVTYQGEHQVSFGKVEE